MPSYYDLPPVGTAGADNFTVEDVNKYNKLPFYMVKNEVRLFPRYKTWDALYGSIKWQANMGPIMRGVRPEPTPIGNSFVYPRSIQTAPNKNVFETLESTYQASLKMHQFESKQFHWIPSFQDFRDNQIKYNHDDIIKQIAVFNEQFLRGSAFYQAPYVMIPGNNGTDVDMGTSELVLAPTEPLPEGTTGGAPTIVSKTPAFLAACAAQVGVEGLSLKTIHHALSIMDEEIGGLPFEGTMNTPRDNELVKGKYVLVCGTEVWRQMVWDESVAGLRSIALDLLFDGFKGSLFGQLTCKPEKFPLRMTAAGAFVAPQAVSAATNETIVNPEYAHFADPNKDAQYEWAFLCAADAMKAIAVGPPPKEFAGKSMSAEKFYSLKWSGEVQLTDQVLVVYSDGSYGLNKYGNLLQLISQSIFGALPVLPRCVLPILFKRRRVAYT